MRTREPSTESPEIRRATDSRSSPAVSRRYSRTAFAVMSPEPVALSQGTFKHHDRQALHQSDITVFKVALSAANLLASNPYAMPRFSSFQDLGTPPQSVFLTSSSISSTHNSSGWSSSSTPATTLTTASRCKQIGESSDALAHPPCHPVVLLVLFSGLLRPSEVGAKGPDPQDSADPGLSPGLWL